MGYSCSDDDDGIQIKDVKVTLTYADGIDVKEGIVVKAKPSGSGTEYEMATDINGSVSFELPAGSYEFTASETRTKDGKLTAYNSLLSRVIGDSWNETSVLKLEMEGTIKSQLIIKELYYGGCPKDDGSGSHIFDSYVVLYNNSTEPVDLKNLCFGTVGNNSNAMKREIHEGDTQAYWFKKNWTPASTGYFYFPNSTILEPYKEILVAIYGAIDHTQTYSQSVDLTDADNYVMFDKPVFGHESYYPAPSSNISPSHYLKAVKLSDWKSTAAMYALSSPSLFLFYPQGQTPVEYAIDKTDNDTKPGKSKLPRKKVPAEWTVDAVEAFRSGYESKNKKRLNPKIDAGYVYMVSKKAYTLYRNVDKETTEAIEGNKDKLVYNYAMGTVDIESKHGTTDPSGIDAEASMTNGAVIIYKDTNNSGNDFHLRQKSSLRK